MSGVGEGGVTAAPGEEVRATVVAELERADRRLLDPLTGRISEIADRLDAGVEVDPVYLERGLRLWRRFGLELHRPQVADLLGPISRTLDLTVRNEGPRRRGGRKAAKAAPTLVTPQEQLLHDYQAIVHNQSMSEARIGELEMLRALYAEQGFGARERLASVLKAFVVSEVSWSRFEIDFVRKALGPSLREEVADRLREGVVHHAERLAHLESEVRAFVAEPIALLAAPPAPHDAGTASEPEPPAPRGRPPVAHA